MCPDRLDRLIEFKNETFSAYGAILSFTCGQFKSRSYSSNNRYRITSAVDRSSVVEFLKPFCGQSFKITTANGSDLLKLCEEFQVPAFKDEVAKFMAANRASFLIPLTRSACERRDDTSALETELRSHLVELVDDPSLCDLPLPLLTRVFQFPNTSDRPTFLRFFQFFLRCLDRYGSEGSVLLRGLDFRQMTHEDLSVLKSRRDFTWASMADSLGDAFITVLSDNAELRRLIEEVNNRSIRDFNYLLALQRKRMPGSIPSEWIPHMKIAADHGNADAQLEFGIALYSGEGIGRDQVQAARYFRMAADAGHSLACFRYAWCLYTGNGIASDIRECIKYMKLSADLGSPLGQFGLSLALSKSGSRAEDYVTVFTYAEVVLQAENEIAQCFNPRTEDTRFYLAYLKSKALAARQFAENRPNAWELALTSPETFGPGLGLIMGDLKRLADLGGSSDQFNYGMAHKLGIGCAQDLVAAAQYLRLSADQRHPQAAFIFGMTIIAGDGMVIDREEGIPYLEIGAACGNAFALVPLIQIFKDQKCLKWVSLAKGMADTGDAAAQICYALLVFDPSAKSCPESLKYMKKAAVQGDPVGELAYGYKLAESGQCLEGLKWMKRAVDHGLPFATDEYESWLERRS
jgi:TPR repeat protein